MLSMLKAILAGVGWVWLARQVFQACLDTEAFLVETKIRSMCPKHKVHITSCARNQIAPWNLKPWNLIPGASSRFSRKFSPMKITCYTVFRSHTKLLLDPICPWDRTKTRNGLGNGSKKRIVINCKFGDRNGIYTNFATWLARLFFAASGEPSRCFHG